LPAIALASALVPAIAAARDRSDSVQRLASALAPGASFSVREASSDLSIGRSPDDTVRVVAHKTAEGGTAAEREALLEEIAISLVERDGGLSLGSKIPERGRRTRIGWFFFGFGEHRNTGAHAWIDYEIALPAGAALGVDLASGSLELSGTSGRASIEAASGDIHVADVDGEISISAASAEIRVRDLRGNVRADVVSGDLACERVAGEIAIEFGSGDLSLAAVDGAITVEGTSGDVGVDSSEGPITITLASGDVSVTGGERGLAVRTSSGGVEAHVRGEARGEIDVRTSSGSVALTLDRPVPGAVDLSTASGAIRARGPFAIDSISRADLRGVILGSGDGRVRIGTSSGDIELVAASGETAARGMHR
jgi:hypothetical protein